MKTTLFVVVCAIALTPTHFVSAQKNNTGIELFTGTSYSPREHVKVPHIGFGYTKDVFKGNGFVGISMSGKRDVLRQETDTSAVSRGFYLLEINTGFSVTEEQSKMFAGPAVIVGGGVCWDNWKLSQSFPLFFSIALQLNINPFDDFVVRDERFAVGIFARGSYEIFYYKNEGEVDMDSRSRTNPMVAPEIGLKLSLKGNGN